MSTDSKPDRNTLKALPICQLFISHPISISGMASGTARLLKSVLVAVLSEKMPSSVGSRLATARPMR